MSIENQIAALTAAVIELTNVIKSGNVTAPAPVAQPIPLVVPTPVAHVAAPVVVVAPAPVMVSPSNVMPAPPVFAPVAAPAPAPVSAAPFTDGKGLIDYVMSAYKAMGAAKGALIQTVLTSLGYQNINDVKPEHYVALFQGIEALKVL